LCDLLAALQLNYPIEAITGHQDIAPGRKSDPGYFFDWAKLQQAGLIVIR
jgi:AmpD protein